MSNLIPLTAGAILPAYLRNKTAFLDINKDVVTSPPYPHISIKGKKFTTVRDGVKSVLMRRDANGEATDEIAQHIEVSVLRANPNARNYYAKKYEPGESDGQTPDCYSMDGVAPSSNSTTPQSGKCALCPQNVWGVRDGKGKACNDQIRLAVATTDKLSEPYLLRVPPASIKGFKEVVKLAKSRNLPYNAVVLRIGFDVEAESPKLTFKPVALLDDESYEVAQVLYEDDKVRAIVGLDDDNAASAAAPAAPAGETDELDAAIAAKAKKVVTPVSSAELEAVLNTAAPVKPKKPAAPVVAVPTPAPAVVSTIVAGTGKGVAIKTSAVVSGDDDLMSELDAMLGGTDD